MESWIGLNSMFSLVVGDDPFGDLTPDRVWRVVSSDLTLPSLPPLFLVRDVLLVAQNPRSAAIREISGPYEELLHAYRNRFLYPRMSRDPSVRELGRILSGKTRGERALFVPFIAREISRKLFSIHPFPFEPVAIGVTAGHPAGLFAGEGAVFSPGGALAIAGDLARELSAFLDRSAETGLDRLPLFSADEVALFSYVRSEEDIPAAREYRAASRCLAPPEFPPASRARKLYASAVETADGDFPTTGGFFGIRAGGDVERLSCALPSELALMETGTRADLFDLKLAEGGVLGFNREFSPDDRKRGDFAFVFASPDSLDLQPQRIPFRWSFFFSALFFSVARFCRDRRDRRTFPVFIAGPEPASRTGGFIRLLELVRAADYPDISVPVVFDTGSSMYVSGGIPGPTLCAVSPDWETPYPVPAGDRDAVLVRYGGRGGRDTVLLEMRRCGVTVLREFSIETGDETALKMGEIRDTLYLMISGEYPEKA